DSDHRARRRTLRGHQDALGYRLRVGAGRGRGGGAPPRWHPSSLARRLRRAGRRTAGPSRRTIPEGDGSPL
ncbi:MAG: hypothetical protein AVDCRST_MAG01-01-2522, partial [uncultured Rubrobacteraceae bacterium]